MRLNLFIPSPKGTHNSDVKFDKIMNIFILSIDDMLFIILVKVWALGITPVGERGAISFLQTIYLFIFSFKLHGGFFSE